MKALIALCALLTIACGVLAWVANDRKHELATQQVTLDNQADKLNGYVGRQKDDANTIGTLTDRLTTCAGQQQNTAGLLATANDNLAKAQAERASIYAENGQLRNEIYARDMASADYGRALMPGLLSDRLRQQYQALAGGAANPSH